ncbi:MAG: aminotransferase class I/II-fold pyridoxal phosphate-dependent enzyme [Acutalibacteraceae bacterium]|nr:aminotransferase class I/II-fold pyridoxal phosphate-dependent enzyme [Acutalibacteraceae bacterium]
MMNYLEMSKDELKAQLVELQSEYKKYQDMNLKLDMSRGKPGSEQLDLSEGLLNTVLTNDDCKALNGLDCRNYGVLDGIPEIKKIFAKILNVTESEIMVGGNSSLNMMFDTIATMMTANVNGGTPWAKLDKVKWLCPAPGYDRHFSITEYFGIEMITVPMTPQGPDMDIVEKLVSEDSSIKGIWCVPKYSNPQGVTYSDETVTRFAKLKPAADDFRIMWDNAYVIHDIAENGDKLLSLMDECKKYGNEDLPIMFTSTSKITFPGAGVACMAASEKNMEFFKKKYTVQTIGYDKINMLRHVKFFGDYDGLMAHMQKHRALLEPRFEAVVNKLENKLGGFGIAEWIKPNGGYFVSVDVLEGCAKRVVQLCKEAGVVLTGAGATFPYGNDPKDSNIRLAPTLPPVEELELAMDLFCICTKLAALEKLTK